MTPTGDGCGLLIGVDVGGTKTHAVAFDADLHRVVDVRRTTQADGGPAVRATILDAVEAVNGQLDGRPVAGIGVGVPGVVDVDTGVIRHAVNLGIGEAGLDIAGPVGAATGVICRVENDVNVAALGVHHALSTGGRSPGDVAYLNVGTGMAAGVVADGRIYRGRHGFAGEIGHLPVGGNGLRCECGLLGCRETVASGAAIARRWPVTGGRSAARALVEAAGQGDRAARAILDDVVDHLAGAVHLLALTFDVDLFVLGGGVADVGPTFLHEVKAGLIRLEDRSPILATLAMSQRVVLKPDADIAVVGAAALVRSDGGR